MATRSERSKRSCGFAGKQGGGEKEGKRGLAWKGTKLRVNGRRIMPASRVFVSPELPAITRDALDISAGRI